MIIDYSINFIKVEKMIQQTEENLKRLFHQWSGESAHNIRKLPQSGSYREYYRIIGEQSRAVGVFNADKKENVAFLTFSNHFFKQGLAVPEIYSEDLDNNLYLIQDIGDTTLFSYMKDNRRAGEFSEKLINIYKEAIRELPRFQIPAAKKLDYSVCYPREAFDKQSMIWDLNYFKYYFLKLAKIPFDEQYLENDFHRFADYLLQVDRDFFLYRDFQSSNIMLFNDKVYFIDYQGGRKGALQYDLASLLFDSKADIPDNIRTHLLEYYLDCLTSLLPVNREQFTQYYYGYVLIRIMQAMGAYGFRGFYEKKPYFLESIPLAIGHLESVLKTIQLPVEIPTLLDTLKRLLDSEELMKLADIKKQHNTLSVTINSFSYKKGIPDTNSKNVGGFVFDCRAIHNPGRYEEYKHLTGKDRELIDFFKRETEVDDFLTHVYSLVDLSVEKFQKQNKNGLIVNFGCVGGTHRSVFCAENLAMHLRDKYNVNIDLYHRELENS